MDTEFVGKRVLVTGAGRGIGKGITKKLIECGAEVVAFDILPELLDGLKSEFPRIETVCVDLTDWEAARDAVISAGPFDLAVNNAGQIMTDPFGQIDEVSLDKLWAINVKAPINISQIVANTLKERGQSGAIVNVASQLSHNCIQEHGAYSATKAALVSITKTMALELGPHQIRCNTVNPSLTKTEMTRYFIEDPVMMAGFKERIPLGKLGGVDDVAEAVLFLLSDRKAGMITGSCLFLDGGRRIS